MPDAVMIFAAGFGTRMGALTKTCPKPLLQVGGKPLLDHALALADRAGVARRVVNTHYLGEQVQGHLATRSDTVISDEADELLDTGGGLRAAKPLLAADPVFTLNSDAVWSDITALAQLAKAWDASRMDALLLTVPLTRAHGRAGAGDFSTDAQGRLHRGGDLVYTGAQIISVKAVEAVEERVFSLNKVWNNAAEAGRIFGLEYPGHWADVGHPEGLVLANGLWEEWR